LVAEGHDPVLIERAAKVAGMAVPPLQVIDEVSLSLIGHAAPPEDIRGSRGHEKGLALIVDLVENHDRKGKAAGAGFYDYSQGRKLWHGLKDLVAAEPEETGLELIQERLMMVQIAEVARVMQDGVIREHRDVEVGAIFGIGFAPNTGGPLSMMDRRGLPSVVRSLETLQSKCGDRFEPAPFLKEMASKNEKFFS